MSTSFLAIAFGVVPAGLLVDRGNRVRAIEAFVFWFGSRHYPGDVARLRGAG